MRKHCRRGKKRCVVWFRHRLIASNTGVAILLLLLAGNSAAAVTAVSASGFISEHRLQLQATPQDAYLALTRDVHRWWDAAHSYSGKAENFSLDARPGGCFCEALPSGGVEHMRVAHAAPGERLNLIGGLGPLQALGVSGTMSFVLEPNARGTQLVYRYAVSGFAEGGLAAYAEPVDQVQLGQLKRLQAFLASNVQGAATGGTPNTPVIIP
ncbi:MAG: hypothetical protein ACR2PZ_04350 [Pseudomonadales bacterium]